MKLVLALTLYLSLLAAVPAQAIVSGQQVSTSPPIPTLPTYQDQQGREVAGETSASPAANDSRSPTVTSSRVRLEGAIVKTIEEITLAAQVAGVIRALQTSEGAIVVAGQELGRLQDEAVRLKLEQLQTQVEMALRKQRNDINQRLAEKGKQVADNELQRALNANARVRETYPINEIDRLRLVADQAQLEVERAKYDLDIAKLEVDVAKGDYRQTYELFTRHKIVAPTPGVVVAVLKRAGEWVEPGTDLLRIVRIDRLRVEGFVPAAQASPDLVGRRAQVQSAEGVSPRSTKARVVFVSPDVNPANSQVKVFLEIDNLQGEWRPGLRVVADIE